MARRTDPRSSHDAATRLEESGTADHQRGVCQRLVVAMPGLTSRELAAHVGDPERWRYILARRLPEVERRGGVYAVLADEGLRWYPGRKPETICAHRGCGARAAWMDSRCAGHGGVAAEVEIRDGRLA